DGMGVDFSRPMLDLARKRLSRFGSRVLLCEGDLAEPDAIEVPHRRYKAAFSIQTMHHLGDREKAAAFAWTAQLVDAGGLVAIVDRVSVRNRCSKIGSSCGIASIRRRRERSLSDRLVSRINSFG
ncbi:MAG: class I SAM-dependent methyltransferase, partial [Gaiellaceae bacterium]